ncbi:alpha/beta hydrolase [Lysobacter sp. D1-1-M9]|uniref:alpha/beta hydrolase n=1 Tax=Novilysobacter longmucuonensis TaxID=3098603 RepID=UPI002FC7496C
MKSSPAVVPSTLRRTMLARSTAAALLMAVTGAAIAQNSPPPATPTTSPAASTQPPSTEAVMAKAGPQMQAVLDQLAELGAEPIASLTPEQARQQPSPADAVKALIESRGETATPEAVGEVRNLTFPGPASTVPVRIYWPERAAAAAGTDATGASESATTARPNAIADADGQPLPVIHYIHGGGWVIADLDTYDASARALANKADAIVVSTHYRQGPEDMFPAAHEDSLAAYQWILDNAESFGGDPERIAVVGESAGGNLAANIAIAARDNGWQEPLHQVLVYPIASNDMNSESYVENANAKPLGKEAMQWFVEHYFESPQQTADPRIALAKRDDLAGLAPATIILAQIDPLRSDGRAYAEALRAAGVPVTLEVYDGVTHEFFGMAAVVDKAEQAQQLAGEQLREAFGQPRSETARSGGGGTR